MPLMLTNIQQYLYLGWEDPLEKGKATYSSFLAWRIPWTVQSIGSQGVGHDWATHFIPLSGRDGWEELRDLKTLQKLRTGREHWGLVVQEEKDVTSPVSPVIPGQSILWKVNSLVTKRYTLYNRLWKSNRKTEKFCKKRFAVPWVQARGVSNVDFKAKISQHCACVYVLTAAHLRSYL